MANTILVVEDDASLARVIARNLTVRGYEVKVTGTVAEARLALAETCPVLVLLDIDLPDGSGWEVARALRLGPCRDSGLIVVSALRPNARLTHELGCFGVLEKPFPMESLLRQVAEHMESHGQSSAPDLIQGGRPFHA